MRLAPHLADIGALKSKYGELVRYLSLSHWGVNTKDGGVQFSGTLVEGFSVLRQMTGLCLPKVAHRLVYAMCQTLDCR